MFSSKLKIFTDFDGTVTTNDTWIEMGNVFIKNKSAWNLVISDFESGKIGARECFRKECSLIENFDIGIFNKIIDSQKIVTGFREFYGFCNERNIKLTILSEGLDYYISRILKNHNLEIPFYSNTMILSDDGKSFTIEFPYSDSDCNRCGTSKRNLLMNLTSDEEVSVFIGDGFSDTCVVHYADIVFAKKSLASYC
ncbi:MAG: HAD-IB family phosphatase, partial [Ignavibacteria bacterium]|nr:HAD-IB family phosphatase [Ignavibacteria bacterium]